jgi:hypothetical protein
VRLQNYLVGDSVAEMRRELSGFPYTEPDQVRPSRFGVSEDTLYGISKIDNELGRASRIDMRRKDVLHLLAQRLCQRPGIRIRCGLNG